MSKHFAHDLDQAYHRLLALSGRVEEMIQKSIKSLLNREMTLVAEVKRMDETVNSTEVGIEDECLKMLALHQPVASDLRRLTTMMKINNDLERIADLACNVAERAGCLNDYAEFPIPELLGDMATETVGMVRDVLNAFVNLDIDLAYSVMLRDDSVDEINVRIIEELSNVLRRDADWVDPAIHCFSASRALEQIADHAVNVAEDVIYMVNGVIVRHGHQRPAVD